MSRALRHFQQANPVGKARRNVAHHYDLGNDLYRLFLGKGLQYSCAYSRKRDAVPLVRDYITDVQRRYREKEMDNLVSVTTPVPEKQRM